MGGLVDKFLIDKNRFDGTVMVTGAGGCIGAWVVAILHASGVKVVAMDLSEDRRRAGLIMGEEGAAQLAWEVSDVTDFAALKAQAEAHKASAIIHLAGLQVPFCAANPALGARVNVEGTINILQTARELGIKRTVYASSIAALALPPGGPYKETLYGAYKMANEHSAFVYWSDWQVPSIGLRPNVVYGLGRDQGMSSKNTTAIHAAVAGSEYKVPYSGAYSWLYAGEAAAAFIACASFEPEGAPVFDLNGRCEKLEDGLAIVKEMAPEAKISCEGPEFPFPADLDESDLRAFVPDYPAISLREGVIDTYNGFAALKAEGRLPKLPD